MVERSHVRPSDGVVALRTVGGAKGRPGGGVDRIVGLLPGGQVAARVAAVRGRNLESVVIVDVALRALEIGVTVCQRESGGAVIENRSVP